MPNIIDNAVRRLSTRLLIKKCEWKFNGKPLDEVQADIRKAILKRPDLYLRDEDTARRMADRWSGDIRKPDGLRFIEGAIPVVMCANESFAPYMAVMLQSLLNHSDPRRKYHFIIFGRELSERTQKYLTDQTEKFSYCAIDFVDVGPTLDNIPLPTTKHVSIDGFSRFFIPYWLDKYEKVIYFDSDMMAKADIAELYDLNIRPYGIGICVNTESNWRIERRQYGYFIKRCGAFALLDNWRHNIQSGVLVFDTARFAEKFSCRDIFRFAIYFTNRYAIRLNDQDTLALLVNGDYFILPPVWNYSWCASTDKGKYLPAEPETKIIHFTGKFKPWQNKATNNSLSDALAFRELAMTVPLYSER